ncbi:protoporphyrinogen oxidase [Anthonomus grandis grandis]|uniref:protoporphyrinogen oxidase n=1 Tax=Anthonomus grandis grandis TaxID=2921223 RepID=UPI002165EA74|nr:protoporphyrinogen oxidase [Anthonomus grandis grandis]
MTKIILGGGLSGLSAAYYLGKHARGENSILLESSSRLGGWIKSNQVEKNVIFEQGPRTIRPRGAPGINTLNLLEELSLQPDVLPIHQTHIAAKNRLIYANGDLHLLPNSLLGMFTTEKPFSKPLIMQILRDLSAKPKITPDESAYEFTKRRFGPEVADYLIDTILCGICAGSSKEISVNFIMKKLFNFEQQHGGVIKGVVKNLFNQQDPLPPRGLLASKAQKENWSVYTFKNGMETLPIALESFIRRLGETNIKLNAKCKELRFTSSGAEVYLENGDKFEGCHVISSLSANSLAPLIQNEHSELSSKLYKIKTVSVGVVNLMYEGNFIKKPGFGFLVPPKEKLPILGVIYDSCTRNQTDKTVLTVMMGGYWFKELFGDNPAKETLLQVATDNIKSILEIPDKPLLNNVNILKDCIPQYVVGHERNLEDIYSYIKDKNLPLYLCGASYNGVGVNDAILLAKVAVENIK